MIARIKSITPGEKLELADLEAKILEERGRISPLYQILLNAPEIARGWEALLTAIRNRNSLSPAIREMIILRVAVLNKAKYEFDAHVPHALKGGLTESKIEALRQITIGDTFNEQELISVQKVEVRSLDVRTHRQGIIV